MLVGHYLEVSKLSRQSQKGDDPKFGMDTKGRINLTLELRQVKRL